MKEPTCVSIVEKAVTKADDFVTAQWLIQATRLSPSQVGASLFHLKKHKALDCFESDGKLWWFSTPQLDTRIQVHSLRKPEVKPRKPRRQKRVIT